MESIRDCPGWIICRALRESHHDGRTEKNLVTVITDAWDQKMKRI